MKHFVMLLLINIPMVVFSQKLPSRRSPSFITVPSLSLEDDSSMIITKLFAADNNGWEIIWDAKDTIHIQFGDEEVASLHFNTSGGFNLNIYDSYKWNNFKKLAVYRKEHRLEVYQRKQ